MNTAHEVIEQVLSDADVYEPQFSPEEVGGAKVSGALTTMQSVPGGSLAASDMKEVALVKNGTEHTVALGFEERFKGSLLFMCGPDKWLKWNGRFWEEDRTNLVAHYCREQSALLGGKKGERASFVRGVAEFCRSTPIFSRTADVFDLDNYLLNCPDGTYDLRTGIRRDHDHSDLITNCASVSPASDYGTRFPAFLMEITEGNQELQDFLQVSLGSCLSGAVEDHWLMFWIGAGRNGKNTLGDAVMDVMGSYARKISSSTLMKSKFEGHSTEIANLAGCRLAVASEVDPSSFWSESRINELTGDKLLSARFMRRDFFQFKRTFKFLVYGNHRPRLTTNNNAVRSRIKMVRFGADFSMRADPDLPQKLRDEAGNILRWLIDGHLKWISNGKRLPPCVAIDAEIKDYIDSQSTTQNWADSAVACARGRGQWQSAKLLYEKYKTWKTERGESPESMTRWGEEMKGLFHAQRRTSGMAYEVVLLDNQVSYGQLRGE